MKSLPRLSDWKHALWNQRRMLMSWAVMIGLYLVMLILYSAIAP